MDPPAFKPTKKLLEEKTASVQNVTAEFFQQNSWKYKRNKKKKKKVGGNPPETKKKKKQKKT